jgi:hypothetical protein
MLRQYCILTSCLSELKASNLPAIDKLKLEVQIIKTKFVLLDHEVARRFAGMATSEQAFVDLYDQVRLLCSSCCTDRRTDKLVSLLDDIKNSLGPSKCSDNNRRLDLKGSGRWVLNAVVKFIFQWGAF